MMKIANIQQELTSDEQLTVQDLLHVKGGTKTDDKRRMRPGGGSTTSSPCKMNGWVRVVTKEGQIGAIRIDKTYFWHSFVTSSCFTF